MTTTTAVDRLLEVVAGTRPTGTDIYAADAELDAVVTGRPFSVRGAHAFGAEFAMGFDHPSDLGGLGRHPTAAGEVVVDTATFEDGGVPTAAHHVHGLAVEGDRIVRRELWCGGPWPAPLLAQMEAARR